MASRRSLALVLRTVDVFETSQVVTLFTRELGKITALAKGARRLKSPFQGGLDLLGVSDIVLISKASETLDLLTEASSAERFSSLRRDLAALFAGYYLAELLSDLTDYHDPHPKLFDAARITLRHLGDARLRPRRVARFELACLRELGLAPSLDTCSNCGIVMEDGTEPVAFGASTGGVLCRDCGPGHAHVLSLSRETLESIRMLASPGPAWHRVDPSPSTLGAVREAVGAVISHGLGRRPRLWPYQGV